MTEQEKIEERIAKELGSLVTSEAEPQLEKAVLGGDPWFEQPQGMEHAP